MLAIRSTTPLLLPLTLLLGAAQSERLSAVDPGLGQTPDAALDPRAEVLATFTEFGTSDHGGEYKDPGAPGTVPEVPTRAGYPRSAPPYGSHPRTETPFGSSSGMPFGGSGGPTTGAAGGPPNDDCSNATVVPGSVVNYNPGLLSTASATTESCRAQEDCTTGSSHDVWWEYTPQRDGLVRVDTLGSTNYDTVLSVFSGCAAILGQFCVQPDELACSNDYFFGTTSLTYFEARAGETYLIKVGADFGSNGNVLDFNLAYFPPNDQCDDATPITGTLFNPPLLSTHNATVENCEAQESCEFNDVGTSNSVWYSFIAPCNGTISANTNGSSYDTVLSVFDGCSQFTGVDDPCIEPNELACDDDGGIGTRSQLNDVPVEAGVEYRIKVADYNTSQGGGYLDFNFIFEGAAAPTAVLSAPANFGCQCDSVTVSGTAAAGSDPVVQWDLDYQSTSESTWHPISSSSTPVTGANLAVWNTSGLAEGYYFLRLTVENACGLSTSTSRVIFVDKSFGNADLRQPASNAVYGRRVCLDGTAFDTCFEAYRIEARPSGGSYSPIGQASYGSVVINDPLGPGTWDTSSLADGTYEVRLTGTTVCSDTAQETHSIVLDNTPPVALISSPENCSEIGGVIPILGQASDTNLHEWKLQYTGGSIHHWATIASGTSNVNGLLASWDTSSLDKDCAYTLRLNVFDQSYIDCEKLQRTEYLVSVGGEGSVTPQRFP